MHGWRPFDGKQSSTCYLRHHPLIVWGRNWTPFWPFISLEDDSTKTEGGGITASIATYSACEPKECVSISICNVSFSWRYLSSAWLIPSAHFLLYFVIILQQQSSELLFQWRIGSSLRQRPFYYFSSSAFIDSICTTATTAEIPLSTRYTADPVVLRQCTRTKAGRVALLIDARRWWINWTAGTYTEKTDGIISSAADSRWWRNAERRIQRWILLGCVTHATVGTRTK